MQVSLPAPSETQQLWGQPLPPLCPPGWTTLLFSSMLFPLDLTGQAHVYWEDLLAVSFLADTLNSPSVSWLPSLASEEGGLRPLPIVVQGR